MQKHLFPINIFLFLKRKYRDTELFILLNYYLESSVKKKPFVKKTKGFFLPSKPIKYIKIHCNVLHYNYMYPDTYNCIFRFDMPVKIYYNYLTQKIKRKKEGVQK